MAGLEHQNDPRLYSIPPAAPFLATLVDALLTGKLIPGFDHLGDALALAGVTIFVPTRRAARALQAEFVARIDRNALLLPRILPLGDIEEDQFLLEQQSDGALDLDPVIGSLERQLLLTRMIGQWTHVLEGASKILFDGEAVIVPASISDAAWLANDLATLMDTVATEEADWAQLEGLVPDDHADWWNLTLAFLKIATSNWPDILGERGAMDIATRRGVLLHRQAEHYRKHGSPGPVIAAGSTGSIPATANLLRTIARIDNGAVVLPGLDRDMDDEVWEGLGAVEKPQAGPTTRTSHRQAAAPGHPQYGLKKLLDSMAVARKNVVHIGGIDNSSIGYKRLREQIVNLSMEPSQATSNWPEFRNHLSDEKSARAFSGVSLIDAPGEQQEALAIALAMREVLNDENKTAALVTPDRVLARRVSVELKRFGIEIDDSAGVPLAETPQGTFVRLVLAVTLSPPDPVTLLALIKHPLATFGLPRKTLVKAVETFELAVIRGNISTLSPGTYHAGVTAAKERTDKKSHVSVAHQRLDKECWQQAFALARAVDAALIPLYQLTGSGGTASFELLVKTTISVLEAVASNEQRQLNQLFGGEAGEALSGFLGELLLCSANDYFDDQICADEWPGLYEALLGSRPVRPHRKTHSRLAIWGPLEARLQHVDRIILGGLNEGTWPASTRNDPFLNRPMKASLMLEPPERRIGLAAHDFQMALGAAEVILTRSERVDNAPTVPSRWVQRLLTLAGKQTAELIVEQGRKYLDWATLLDRRVLQNAENLQFISQPEPKPELNRRPKKLRVTEIETWIRDPYAIYARHVLDLEALEPIRREADARERGILYHGIFEKFSKSWHGRYDTSGQNFLLEIAREHFSKIDLPDNVTAFWWPRFMEIAAEFINWEAARSDQISGTLVELSAKAEVGSSGFVITGRADRIDQEITGGHTIIDYKTGTNPSLKQANILLAPQLPIEGALALRGGFAEIDTEQINSLLYVRLRASGGFKVEEIGKSRDHPDAHQLSMDAWTALEEMVVAYEDPDKGYLSRARPFKQGDFSSEYDHLARVMEWSLEDEENEPAS